MDGGATEGEPAAGGAAELAAVAQTAEPSRAGDAGRRRRSRTGLRWRLLFLALALGLILGGYSLIGRSIPLPVWMVAEVEARLNRALAPSLPDAALALGAVDLTLDEDYVPRLRLEDVRVLKAGGEALLTLPEVRLALQGRALLQGEARVASLRITGARVAMTRDSAGRVDFAMGDGGFSPQVNRFADLFDLADRALAAPGLVGLTRIEAEALTLRLTDKRSGRVFELGDGRLRVENRADALAAELAVSIQGSAAQPGRAVMQLVSEKGASKARLSVEFNDIAAADLAVQAPFMAPLASLEAPISGRLAVGLTDRGVEALEGALEIGKGALRPTEAAQPVVFDRASLAMAYQPDSGEMRLTRFEVESPTLRASSTGQAFLIGADGARITGPLSGALPAAFVSQISFDDVRIDPEGMFEAPVHFSSGALDARLRLDPFQVEIGQLALAEEGRRLVLKGRVGADAKGWAASLDLTLNEIAHDKLVALWPKKLLARTRDWIGRNILQGTLQDIKAALRIAPGAEPRLHLSYTFDKADVRFLATLPPVQGGKGYSTIEGLTYTMVMTKGQVTAPQGGAIDVAGSVFAVPDVTAKPARAEIRLSTRSSLTATLSLLNLPPFNFMTKADRPVDLGEGRAEVETRLTLPLQKKVALADVNYDVKGRVLDFRSDKLVAGREIVAEALDVTATPHGLEITGKGHLGAVPFDVTFAQGFGPDQKGRSTIRGDVMLSQVAAEEFGLGLPAGMVSGQGRAAVEIDLQKGEPGELRLTSDLQGIGLTLPEVGWTKGRDAKGRLEAEVTLGAVPAVHRLALEAAGLKATGKVALRAGGGLDVARFDRVTLKDWLDATVEFTGRGPGEPVAIGVTGGEVDIRSIPSAEERGSSASGQGSGPLTLALDRLVVTSTIALTDFRGRFGLSGGFSGDFTAAMNGGPAVNGTVVPSRHGTAVRLQSQDGGATIAAAGLFASARGGDLDMTLTPRETPGHYDGRLTIANVRVRNANVLAELLNAISVVGLLEQLNGQGLVFNAVEGDFLLTPDFVDLRRGSATGASLGVSMAGLYTSATGQLAMQGVISPVYLLNGIGAILTKRGEGVFGFNYTLEGTADTPEVGVNPLSILTPGMFRELFRPGTPREGGPVPKPKQGRD
ncbi:YhdP family protein [Tabrizicola oligotrophica]|uniref:YhdP central domain-containing protein n=1 Tax=Tabrizicola oligotrophica TaxID=2710650 RepID=A0A6M0QNH1_9RHOB|nr:AsmA-like C-terminal region-containing protein [Tabrizicola oligotrophica]NEY88937.1 hypothetical protein [Tabrizicola oligotrophica]